jgi:hypothetical protein
MRFAACAESSSPIFKKQNGGLVKDRRLNVDKKVRPDYGFEPFAGVLSFVGFAASSSAFFLASSSAFFLAAAASFKSFLSSGSSACGLSVFFFASSSAFFLASATAFLSSGSTACLSSGWSAGDLSPCFCFLS